MENLRRAVSTPGQRGYIGSDKIRNEILGRANDSIVEMFPGYDVMPRTIGTADYDQMERELIRINVLYLPIVLNIVLTKQTVLKYF